MPAFGSPTRPMSAIRRSSSRIQRSAPGSPFWACLGAWWVDVLKWVLPSPPRPPRATIAVWPTRHEVGEQRPGLVVVDGGAGRDVEDQVVAGLAVAARPRAAAAGRRPEVVAVVEVAKGRLAGVDPEVDRAAAAAVAAVGTAARDVRLLPEGRGPVAAIAGADPDLHAVEEHRGHSRTGCRRPPPAGAGRSGRAPSRRGLEVAERVDALAAVPDGAAPDLEVAVRTGRVAGLADAADRAGPPDVLARARP